MLGFKKNIWTIFWAFTVLGVVLYIAYAAKLWRAHTDDHLNRQIIQNELMKINIESFVSHHFTILDLLAINFIATRFPAPRCESFVTVRPCCSG